MRASVTLLAAVAAVAGACSVSAATSSDNYVDLQLILAVDVSGSMDYREQQVQRDGYVQAFRDPEVINAILSGPYGRISVTYIQWAGAFIQQTAVPWTVIKSKDDAMNFAAALTRAPVFTERGTSISAGLSYAASAFDISHLDSDRRTIDVSGDGSNNDGAPLMGVRDKLVKQGIAINGLPILLNPAPVPGNIGFYLDDYYHDCVIGGPASFVIPIKAFGDFAPAIRRKLILEIASNQAPIASPIVRVADTRRGVDCAAAERGGGFGFFP
jgi:hypothetical protein